MCNSVSACLEIIKYEGAFFLKLGQYITVINRVVSDCYRNEVALVTCYKYHLVTDIYNIIAVFQICLQICFNICLEL